MRLAAIAALVAFTLCCGLLGKAAWLTGKATLAQLLLDRSWDKTLAWHKTLQHQQPSRPWPWADIHPAARLVVDRLGVDQIALWSHSGEAMAFGPGLIRQEDAWILAGHRDSHLNFVKDLRLGDTLRLQDPAGNWHSFTVSETAVVDTRVQPAITGPPDSLILITCYPFDAIRAGGPLRYLVAAKKKPGHRPG